MQRIVSISAGEPLTVVVDRGGAPVTLKAKPELRELKDNFGNVHRLGVLGIGRSMQPGDLKTKHYTPLQAVGEGARRPGPSSNARSATSRACSQAAKRPTSSAVRSGSRRFQVRSRPSDSSP